MKIRLVTAEIFLIWTNVAKANVAWINVTVVICAIWSTGSATAKIVGTLGWWGGVCKAIFVSKPTYVELSLS